ncbi:MAG TPA: IS1595 family transposase [Planctomycetaceae bacterium]|jgi:transposase-like protein|nr:IS1595 family transposase [Planctomycetaceae bacterium]
MATTAGRLRCGATTDDVTAARATTDEKVAPAEPRAVARQLPPRAANAATHGLSATRYLPEILGKKLLERHRQRFLSEWRPSTATQAYLVEELARHAAALERATLIEEAVLRTSARGLSGISDLDGDEEAGADRVLAAAYGSETVDRVTRYRRAHEKGFLAALARLRELRAMSDAVVVPPADSRLRFEETTCLRYLQRYRDDGELPCPSCAGADGKWLADREHWQCRHCRKQVSARSGTVLARSPLPLRVWFAAIAAILQDRQVSTEALCDITGIRRGKTVRALAQRIRQAIDSPEAERLLAGLDTQTLKGLAGSSR